jgi:ABC-type uncharacterized transport system involved in gliding motility auxiliary subunit
MNRSDFQRFLKEYSYITGPLALASLAAFVIRFLVWRGWLRVDALTIVFLALGILLGALFVLGNPTQVRATLTKRGTRYGLNAAVMSIAFIAILVFLNYVADQEWFKYTYDFTATKVHTLSPQSKQVVAEINQPVKIVGFFTADTYSQQQSFQELLDQYERADKNNYLGEPIMIDPDRQPLEARAYAEPYQGLLIQSGSRTERVYSAREQDITSALLKVTSEKAKVVYFLTGHGERDPEDSADEGYATMAGKLRDQNYEVKTLNLAITNTVPSDAAVVVIAGPQSKLLDDELTRLQSYLNGGGRALILQDPFYESGLNIVLSNWQVRFGDGIVVDRLYSVQSDTFPAAVRYGYSPVTKDMNGMTSILLHARHIEKTGEIPAGITYTALWETSEESWAETSAESSRDENDIAGPLTLAALIESSPFGGGGSGSTKTRIVLVGDSDFAANYATEIPGNSMLFLNSVNWLAEEERLIAIGPKDTMRGAVVFPDDITKSIILFISVIAIPGAVLLAGLAVWIVRRVALSAWSKTARRQDSESA